VRKREGFEEWRERRGIMEVEEEMERVRLCETGRRKRKRLISCSGFLYLICLSCAQGNE